MTENKTIEYVEGTGELSGDFSNMDMNFNLKLESYIPMCLPTNYENLEEHFKVANLRKQGIAPIVYYTSIQNTPQPVSFARPIYVKNKVLLRRSITEYKEPGRPDKKVERLIFDLSTEVSAHQNTGGAEKLGLSDQDGEIIPVGKINIYQIFTKPMALPKERRMTEIPEELRLMQEHPLQTPFPTIEHLREFPKDYQEDLTQAQIPFYSVWGVSNTDVNQHVNMLEYIEGFQNHFTRLLFQAKKPIPKHFVHEAQIIFRKPFFPGQCYAIQGKIGFDGDRTVLVAGFHLADEDGTLDPNPSTFARLEGSFCLRESRPVR